MERAAHPIGTVGQFLEWRSSVKRLGFLGITGPS